jgi:hypothetical protein
MFVHLNGSVDGVPVEFYADAEEGDLIGASLERQNVHFMRNPRKAAQS